MRSASKAKRFTVGAGDLLPDRRYEGEGHLECDHCERTLKEGDYAFRTPRGVYCSTTCKMWHEGQREVGA